MTMCYTLEALTHDLGNIEFETVCILVVVDICFTIYLNSWCD